MLDRVYRFTVTTGAILFALAGILHLLEFVITDSVEAQAGAAFYGVMYLLMQEERRHG